MDSFWNFYPVWLLVTSLITFLVYGFDKAQSKHNGSRVPESVLHLLALVGGFPGGWAGRIVFHHKTQKVSFTLVLLISTALHIGLVYWVIFR
jgi:uncharacterized membrane protein YsdA (DUF1294 family)